MDAVLIVVFVVIAALVIGVALREGSSPPKPAPEPAKKAPAPKTAVSATSHDLGGGVVVQQISIDRFAIAPHELHPDEDIPGRDPLAHAATDALRGFDDEPTTGRAVALVARLGSGGSSAATAALLEARRDAGALMLELGASGRAPMDVDVARTIAVHLFEMEATLSIDEVRARYAAHLGEGISVHLRDASGAHVDALAPRPRPLDGANVVVTTRAALDLPGVVEIAVPAIPDDLVKDDLARAGATDAAALVPFVAGDATALLLVRSGLYEDAAAFPRALEAARGEGLARVLAATLASVGPELEAMARALAILPTSFDLPTAECIGGAPDEEAAMERLARLVDAGILATAARDKFDRERVEVRPVLRALLREGIDDLAERALVLEMANRLLEEEKRYRLGPSKRAPALYLLGLDWPSFDLARTIARARASEHATFAKGVEIFEKGAPTLLALRPAMAKAWGR